MAYVVGLTATDGCLITGRRAINFKSGDRQLVETYLRLLGRKNRVKSHPTSTGGIAYYTQFHDSRLYEWFRPVGLTPRKSLAIGGLSAPDVFLMPSPEDSSMATALSLTRSTARIRADVMTTTGNI